MSGEPRPAEGRLRGAGYGILAALLFGVSAPIAKLLLPGTGFLMLASLLYLGAGAGLTAFASLRPRPREAMLRRADVLPLAGITITGGIIGPVLLLYGLQSVSGLAGSLLLNLEAPFTMLIAVLLFREHLSRGEVMASALIVGGAVALSAGSGELRAGLAGGLAIMGACFAWGIDNNLTQKVSVRDPIAIVRVKTLGAGLCTLLIALAAGQPLPSKGNTAAALVLGLFSYGISILLDAYALRLLGAAREAAFFATAPFVGALVSIPLLHERISTAQFTGFLLMAAGVIALLRARHGHSHRHEVMVHDHVHEHDDHHLHTHAPGDPPGQKHSHEHRHNPMTHEHPHVSDVHHRHQH